VDSEVKKEEVPSNDHVSKCAARISPVPSRQEQFTWEQLLSPAAAAALSLSHASVSLIPPPSLSPIVDHGCPSAGILNQQSYTQQP
jgi:hypothetical protein